MKRRLLLALAAAALAAAAPPPSAQAAFGLNGFEVGFEEEGGGAATQAGSHPYSYTTAFGLNYSGEGEAALPEGEVKDLRIAQPPGFLGDPTATPRCATADFLSLKVGVGCPPDTQVGTTSLEVNTPGNVIHAPVYNLVPPPGVPLRLGFKPVGVVPVVVDGGLEPESPYDIVATLRNVRQVLKFFGGSLTLWGTPAEHGTGAAPKPFLTLPASCGGPLRASYEASSWQGGFDSGFALAPGLVGCGRLGFSPQVSSKASTDAASSASGLDFSIDFADEGLKSPTGLAQSTLREAVVALPPGMSADPSLAEGLGTCSMAQVGIDAGGAANAAPPHCPESSKVGTVEVQTPLLEEAVQGQVYWATPDDPSTAAPENPFNSLLAFYIVLQNQNQGILIKLPAKVAPDPKSGQLITTVREIPQLPFSHFVFHFREGQRAPLITPPACGTYATTARLTPSAHPAEPLTVTAGFQITHGPGGGPCPPGGTPPFHPGFQAGSLNNNAGSYSPFTMRLTRQDGEQDMTRFAATLPPGVTGKLAGVDRCPEAQIALAKAKSARAELASPSCPANSKIGSTLAAAGVGAELTYVPGSLYLAGPFHGDPLSVVAITPALAGPFDVGTVVVREALAVNPRTAQVSVDPAASEPIPHILAGVPLNLRELRVFADRPEFTLNPTSCDPAAAQATLWGSYLNLFDPAASTPEAPVGLATRYQAAGCAGLGFKPAFALRLKGGTARGRFPKLTTTYTPRPGDANLRRLVLRLPRSEFVEQAHFRTICTRVQYAAGVCPAASAYGHAKVFTPLLSQPLEGPVYERSSSHNLPDLVLSLHGLIDVEVPIRIDSVNGALRATVEEAPDAPVSKAILNMQGGKKGLIVNSTNICGGAHKAKANLTGQNGHLEASQPPVRAQGCGKAPRKHHHRSS